MVIGRTEIARASATRIRRIILGGWLLPLLLLVQPALAQPEAAPPDLCAEANRIAATLTGLSGLPLHHKVECGFITKEQTTEFLRKRLSDTVKPEEIRAEELVLRKFGLVPEGYNLEKATIELLTEQASAFYDYQKKRLYINTSTSESSQEAILAHELSHALADQSFNLSRYMGHSTTSDDQSSARLAVMEGQATWLMSEYLAHEAGRSLKDSPMVVKMLAAATETSGTEFPVFNGAPLYMRRTLVFPYTAGLLFQHELILREGTKAFTEVFQKAPVSTHQILHPAEYPSGAEPSSPALPEARLPKGYKRLTGGVLGELEHSILLEQFIGRETADRIAPHWKGCRFDLTENKKEARAVLRYAVEFDTAAAAREYLAAYRTVLGKKWKDYSVTSESDSAVTGTGGSGGFELRLNGAVMTSVEGLPASR
jgi:hypothetical protein